MMEFCKQFNARTSDLKSAAVMRVKLRAFEDRTFDFDVLPPSTTWYLKRVTGVQKGASKPGHEVIGDVSIKAIYEIAKSKQSMDPSMAELPIKSLVKTVMSSARTLGLNVTR